MKSCTGRGLLPREQLTLGELTPRYVKQIFSRKYETKGQGLDSDQLQRAVERRAGFVSAGEEPPSRLAEQLAKTPSMHQSGASAEVREETPISKLESVFMHDPQAHALDRTTRGRCNTELAESIYVPVVEGWSPWDSRRS